MVEISMNRCFLVSTFFQPIKLISTDRIPTAARGIFKRSWSRISEYDRYWSISIRTIRTRLLTIRRKPLARIIREDPLYILERAISDLCKSGASVLDFPMARFNRLTTQIKNRSTGMTTKTKLLIKASRMSTNNQVTVWPFGKGTKSPDIRNTCSFFISKYIVLKAFLKTGPLAAVCSKRNGSNCSYCPEWFEARNQCFVTVRN